MRKGAAMKKIKILALLLLIASTSYASVDTSCTQNGNQINCNSFENMPSFNYRPASGAGPYTGTRAMAALLNGLAAGRQAKIEQEYIAAQTQLAQQQAQILASQQQLVQQQYQHEIDQQFTDGFFSKHPDIIRGSKEHEKLKYLINEQNISPDEAYRLVKEDMNREIFERQALAIRELINPILDLSDQFMEGFILYFDGLSETKTHFAFNVLVSSELSNKMHQSVDVLKLGKATALKIQNDGGSEAKKIKIAFENAFDSMAIAAEHDIEGFKAGIFFAKSNAEFEKGKVGKIVGMKEAIKALNGIKDLNIELIFQVTKRDSVTKVPAYIVMLERFLKAYEGTKTAYPVLPKDAVKV